MKKMFIKLVSFLFMIGALSSSAIAIDKLHFVVPGGAGGGWDGCARGTGEALVKSGLLESASFENMSGGGGGKALSWMIKTCLLYTSPSPRDQRGARMPSSA